MDCSGRLCAVLRLGFRDLLGIRLLFGFLFRLEVLLVGLIYIGCDWR
jgi:hypothetical protein